MHSRDVLMSIMSVHYLISRHGNQMLRELHVGGGIVILSSSILGRCIIQLWNCVHNYVTKCILEIPRNILSSVTRQQRPGNT